MCLRAVTKNTLGVLKNNKLSEVKTNKNSWIKILILFGSFGLSPLAYAYNFCQSQPSGGDAAWDMQDNGSSTIPFNFDVGDEVTSIEQISSVTIRGLHQYAGDMAAEIIPPGGSPQGTSASSNATYDPNQSVILFRLGDGRYGESASNCGRADFDLTFTDNAPGTDLSVNDEGNYCTGSNNRSAEGVWPQPYLPNFPFVGNSPALNGNPKTYNSEGITTNQLTNLIGKDPKGTWGVYVEDAYAQDVGTVTEVCVDMDFGSVTYDIWVSKNATCTDKKDSETFDYGETVYLCYEASNQATEDFTFVSETNNHGVTLSGDLSGLYEDKFSGTTTHREAYRSFTAGSGPVPVGTSSLSGSITVEGSGTYFAPGEFITTGETVSITVNPAPSADLSVTKTLNTAGPFTPGQTVNYTIVVSNSSSSDVAATNVVVEDLPTNLTITGVSSTNCSSLPCTIPSLAVGASETITVTATAP